MFAIKFCLPCKILNSGCSDIQSLIILRSSSIGESVNISKFSILVWSSELKFKIWGMNVRSSPIRGHLHYEQFSILVWSPKLRFKIWWRSNQWLLRYFTLIFWGHLPLEVIFIMSNFQCWFGPLSLSLKFEDNWISGCWNTLLLKCWGRLPSIPFFILYYSLLTISILGWSPKLKLKIWKRSDQPVLRYFTFNILRSSSIGGHLQY